MPRDAPTVLLPASSTTRSGRLLITVASTVTAHPNRGSRPQWCPSIVAYEPGWISVTPGYRDVTSHVPVPAADTMRHGRPASAKLVAIPLSVDIAARAMSYRLGLSNSS